MTDTSPQSPAVGEAATKWRECRHEDLQFGSGGFYVMCCQCGARWVAIGNGVDADIDYRRSNNLVSTFDHRLVARPERREIVEDIARQVGIWGRRLNLEGRSSRDRRVTTNDVEDFIRSLADKTNAAPSPPAGEWQPIETAPKDGTPIDLWGGSRFVNCRWGRHDDESVAPWGEPHWRGVPFYRRHGNEQQLPVTHWRPLPAPPPSAPVESGGLCEDCPPVGYPTDKTRCTPCPRRSAPVEKLR